LDNEADINLVVESIIHNNGLVIAVNPVKKTLEDIFLNELRKANENEYQGLVFNTFKESARNKMFYLLIFFGILFALSSKLISFLTLGDTMKVLKDTGLAAINFFCVLIAIFTGINLVYKEIEKKPSITS